MRTVFFAELLVEHRCQTLEEGKLRIPLALFVVVTFCSPSICQTEAGTIIVVAQSHAKIVVAADSRASHETGPPTDGFCKITVLNSKLVFAAAGIIQDESPMLAPEIRFLARDVAREVDHDFKPDSPPGLELGTVGLKALQWGNIMSGRMRQGVSKRLDVWLQGQPQKPLARFVEGIFAGIEPGGELSVVVSIVDYIPPREGWITPIARSYLEGPSDARDITWIEPYGMPQVAWDYIHGDSEFSKTIHKAQLGPPDKFDDQIPIELVGKTIAEDRSPEPKGVGGKIDALKILPSTGVQWIVNPNCTQTGDADHAKTKP